MLFRLPLIKFPHNAPRRKVLKTLEAFVFRVVRRANHIAPVRNNPDGTTTPLTMPNHLKLKGSTL